MATLVTQASQDIAQIGQANVVQGVTGQNTNVMSDPFGAAHFSESLPRFAELARSGALYHAFVIAAGKIAPVQADPTTTGFFDLYNAAPTGSGIYLSVIAVTASSQSGTTGAGTTLRAGVTGGVLATPLTANDATNYFVRNVLSPTTSDPTTFFGTGKTVVQAQYTTVGTSAASAAVGGSGVGGFVDGLILVPPQFALDVAILAPTGTSPTYTVDIFYAKLNFSNNTGTPA